MKEQKENSTKGWLQRLKDESWEAELLVSAIAIYGTFQLFEIVISGTNFFINVLNPSQYIIAYFIITFGLLGVSILSSMFVIHFFLRAYWIGLVGLNSVFPDYSIEDSAYSKIYTEKILSILPKLKESIHKVDELCSVIFSSAFTFLMIYAYTAIFSSIYLLLFNLLSDFIHSYILLIPLLIIAIGFVVQTTITLIANLKKNKEKRGLQILNFKIVKIFSMILYGPLYKNILQVSMVFGSNFKKKKSLTYLILTFLLFGLLVFAYQFTKTNVLYLMNKDKYFDISKTYSDYYKTENSSNDFLLAPEINSHKITADVLEVFIPVYAYERGIRKQICGEYIKEDTKSLSEEQIKKNSFLIDCYKKYNFVYLNNKQVAVDFIRYNNHPKTKQFGLLGYVDLSSLSKGLHEIRIEKVNKEGVFSQWTIPFYYNLNQNK
ncbi:MAG: hypothetical protein ACPGU6_07000 [Tenacibaculum sp.]